MAFDINKFKKNADTTKAAEGLAKAKENVGQDAGLIRRSVLRLEKAPYRIGTWSPTAGHHMGDIVGTLITRRDLPSVRNGEVAVGDYDFGLKIWTHPDAKGGGGYPHICLKRNGWAPTDPRCEEFFRKKEDGGTFVKGLKGSGNPLHRSSQRVFLIWVPRDNLRTPGKVAYIFDAPMDGFGDELLEEANALSGGGQPAFFWWPTEHGRTIEFDAVPGDLANSFDFKRFKFHERPESVGASLYEQFSFPLDEIMIVPTAQQMEDQMFGRPADDEEEEAPRTTSATASRSTYHQEEQDAPDTQETRRQHTAPEPENPAEDGKWAKPDTTAPKNDAPEDTGNKCPQGLVYGTSVMDTPQPRACRNCDEFEVCVTQAERGGR